MIIWESRMKGWNHVMSKRGLVCKVDISRSPSKIEDAVLRSVDPDLTT